MVSRLDEGQARPLGQKGDDGGGEPGRGVDARAHGRAPERQAAQAAIVSAGGVWFSLEDDGELVVVRASSRSFEPLRRYKVADTPTWAPPAISGHRVFIKDLSSLALWTVD